MPAPLPRTSRRGQRALPSALVIAVLALPVFISVSAASASTERPDENTQEFSVSVSPGHGRVGSKFQATLTITGGDCDAFDVAFYLDGAVQHGLELAPVVTMPPSCSAVATITVPSGWSTGMKRIVGTYQTTVVPPHERPAKFFVDPAPQPTHTRPSSTAPATQRATSGATPSIQPSVEPSDAPKASPSDPPSAGSLIAPSPNGTAGYGPQPVSADIGATSDGPADLLLWTASIGIIVVGFFGGWAALRQSRLAAGSTLAASHAAGLDEATRRLGESERSGRHRR